MHLFCNGCGQRPAPPGCTYTVSLGDVGKHMAVVGGLRARREPRGLRGRSCHTITCGSVLLVKCSRPLMTTGMAARVRFILSSACAAQRGGGMHARTWASAARALLPGSYVGLGSLRNAGMLLGLDIRRRVVRASLRALSAAGATQHQPKHL